MTDISIAVSSEQISNTKDLLSKDQNDPNKKAQAEASYRNLVFENRPYRLLLLAWLSGELGECVPYSK